MSRIIEHNPEKTGWRFVDLESGIELLFGSSMRPLCQAHIGGCGQAISLLGLKKVFRACAPEQKHGGCEEQYRRYRECNQDGFISNELEVDFFNELIPPALCLDHQAPNDVHFKRSCRSIRQRWRSLIHAELQLGTTDDDGDDNTDDEAEFIQKSTKKSGSDKSAPLRNSAEKKSCKTPQRPQLPRRNDDFSLKLAKPKRSRRDSSCDYMTESPGSVMSDMSPEASPVFDSLSPSLVETPPTAVPTGRSSGAKEQESPTKRTLKIKRLARTGTESECFPDEHSDEDGSEDDTDSAKGSSDREEFVEQSGEDSLLVAELSRGDGEESEEDASFVAEPSRIRPRIQPVAPVITINVSISEEEALPSDASSEQPSDVNSESDGNEHGSGRELVQKPAPRPLSRPGSTVSVRGRLIDLIPDPSDSDEERTGGNSRRPQWRKVKRPGTESQRRRSSSKQNTRSDESADDAPERGELKDGHPRVAVQRLLFPPKGKQPASSTLRSRSEDSKSIPRRSRPGLISQPRASSSTIAPVQSHGTSRKLRDEARDPPSQPATRYRLASSESRYRERDSTSKRGSWRERVTSDDESDLDRNGKTEKLSSHRGAQHMHQQLTKKRGEHLEDSNAQIMRVFEAGVAVQVQMATDMSSRFDRLEQLVMGLCIKDSSPVKASIPEREPEPPRTKPPKLERATLFYYPDAMGLTQATPASRSCFKKYELPQSTRLAAELLAKMRDGDRRKAKQDGHGYVYGYIREDLPGYVKIGSSEAKDPEVRMKTWEKECGVKPHLVFCLETDYAGTWTEGLMHIQLHQWRRTMPCPKCKNTKGEPKGHDEWFEMGAYEAMEHARLWKRFINLDLYDPNTSDPVRSLGLWIQQQKPMIGEYSADASIKTTPKKGEDEQHKDIDSVMKSLEEFIEGEKRHQEAAEKQRAQEKTCVRLRKHVSSFLQNHRQS